MPKPFLKKAPLYVKPFLKKAPLYAGLGSKQQNF